ncbi:MAG: hypothetical protein ACR2P0_18420 [Acidimicrobiales bacterium]
MQLIIRESGEGALTEPHSTMRQALRERTIIAEFAEFDPKHIAPHYVPGVTTMSELRQNAGMFQVLDYSNLIGILFERDVLELRYDEPLRQECNALETLGLQGFCDGGSTFACDELERFPDRDLELIAEACALAPYLLPCDPDDPPPRLVPPREDF